MTERNELVVQRVLFACTEKYPHVGGLSSHLEFLTRYLTQKPQMESEVISADKVRRWKRLLLVSLPLRVLNLLRRGLGVVWAQTVLARLVAREAKRILATKPIDIINVEDALLYRGIEPVVQRCGVPIVLTVHADITNFIVSEGYIRAGGPEQAFFLRREREAYERAQTIIAVDSRLKAHIEGLTSRRDVIVIHNSIDTEEFRPSSFIQRRAEREKFQFRENSKVILCPRRLVPKNGVIYAVEVLAKLLRRDHGDDFTLVFAGAGILEKELKRRVRELKLDGQVIFLGAIPHAEMPEVYNAADYVIIPSITCHGVQEATSIACLEAMACGKVVLASRIGGLKEIIAHRRDGILVTEGDTEDFAENIVELEANHALKRSIEVSAREKVLRQFSHRTMGEQFLKVWARTIAQQPRRVP